jgi:LPS export ABC transporter protein LptC
MRLFNKVSGTALFLILTVSCSLNYGNEQSSESSVPEFSFENATYNRYSNNKKTAEIKASRLEQYKSDGRSYAKDAQFKTYNDYGDLDTEGECTLLAADTREKHYSLYQDIVLSLHSQDMTLNAQALFFDGKTEQLTGSIDDDVKIIRKNTEVTGRGFSASGVNRTYSFNSSISGTVTESEEKEDELPEVTSEEGQ